MSSRARRGLTFVNSPRSLCGHTGDISDTNSINLQICTCILQIPILPASSQNEIEPVKRSKEDQCLHAKTLSVESKPSLPYCHSSQHYSAPVIFHHRRPTPSMGGFVAEVSRRELLARTKSFSLLSVSSRSSLAAN
jgi:hypothetical protein